MNWKYSNNSKRLSKNLFSDGILYLLTSGNIIHLNKQSRILNVKIKEWFMNFITLASFHRVANKDMSG